MTHSRNFAQIFGGNPPSLQWKQINTSLARIIFPEGLDSTAERITNIISLINAPTLATIGTKSKKINLVLQNQTTISNAYVGLGPFRSEFLIMPLQNSNVNTTVTIDKAGRVVIPKGIRDELRLRPGGDGWAGTKKTACPPAR